MYKHHYHAYINARPFDMHFQCSTSCGRGTKTRTLVCKSADGSHVLANSHCPPDRPTTTDHCIPKPCNTDISEYQNLVLLHCFWKVA